MQRLMQVTQFLPNGGAIEIYPATQTISDVD